MKKIILMLIIGILFLSGCGAMRPIITFNPLNESPVRFDLESSVVISRQRNAPSKATIALPNVRAIRDLTSFNEVEITYNDIILFDGKTQQKTNNGNKIIFQANDWLWDFERKKRSFTQSTDNLRPDQLFTNAFDENEVFDYLKGEWENYITPWIDGFDARTNIVPADVNLDYTDALNSENLSGKGFMEFLANASYLQHIYRYFYWFNNINKDRFLFFQPDGWGKIWKDFDFTTLNFSEISEYLFNNIVIWGANTSGYFPVSGDFWTESDINGWDDWSTTISLDTANAQVGKNCIKLAMPNTWHSSTIYRSLLSRNEPINLNNLEEFYVKVYVPPGQTHITVICLFVTTDGPGTWYAESDVLVAGAWNNVSLSYSDFSHAAGGASGDEININELQFYVVRDYPTYLQGNLAGNYYCDGMYIITKPIRSDNLANNSGYDSTSKDNYGFRSSDVYIRSYNKIVDCNQMASNIVNYLKDPHYSAKIKIPGFESFDLNDNIKGSFFDNELTLPIDKITWVFKPKGEIITTTDLGIKGINLEKILQKLFGEMDIERYDRGQTYYIS